MARTNDVGLFKWKNKNGDEFWGYRIVVTRNNKRHDIERKKDDDGNYFRTKTEAKRAREKKNMELQGVLKAKPEDATVEDVWNIYLSDGTGRQSKNTVKRYKSLWKNHIKSRFSDVLIKDLNTTDIEKFLEDLYFKKGLSYSYVEGFIKFFYLIGGNALRANKMDIEQYVALFDNKASKIRMPKKTQEDARDEDVRALNTSEVNKIYNIAKGTSFYIPFVLGYYCGLRVSEVYGLTWDDFDLFNQTITIDKQMQYDEDLKCFTLDEVKTLASCRVIDLPEIVYDILKEHEEKLRNAQLENQLQWKSHASELVLDVRFRGKPIELIGHNFINRRENGDLLTPNSPKRWIKKIKEVVPDFHFHQLRVTHITRLAEMNTPVVEVMQRVGHKKYETTMRYYVSTTTRTHDTLIDNINLLNTEETHRKIVINGVEIDMTDDFIKKLNNLRRLSVEEQYEEYDEDED